VYVRRGEVLRRVRPADGFVSPRLKIRFRLTTPEMTVYHPDGRPFLAFDQLEAERVRAEKRAEQAEEWRRQAEEARRQAEEARRHAEQRATQAAAEIERLRRLLGDTDQTGQQG
jgi:hypothetical protein